MDRKAYQRQLRARAADRGEVKWLRDTVFTALGGVGAAAVMGGQLDWTAVWIAAEGVALAAVLFGTWELASIAYRRFWTVPFQVHLEHQGRIADLEQRIQGLQRTEADKDELREAMATLMLEGQELFRRLTSTDDPLDEVQSAITAWAERSQKWLLEKRGKSYVARFQNSAGIPIGVYSPRRYEMEREMGLFGGMRVCLTRLGEFLEELGPAP